MISVSVNKFREQLKSFVEQVINDHQPMKVTRRNGKDFVVIGAEDWEQEQETLYILENRNLIQQISESQQTHVQNQGYQPNDKEIDEILSF